ncbi:MAG TPA: GTPase HflX [Candidatus Bathyarchaeia archaeon]|nr:GTPase HflX [Candidatus Bathyarchaeia archaeon]
MQRRLHENPSLDELNSLAQSAGYEVVGRLEQVRQPDPRYQIGSGKVEELRELVTETSADKIIFDNDLKPVQSYNLAKETGIEAIDRFQLILEIFAKRASTREAQLQIQLARLNYELAHAKERVKLAKKEEQPGFMGLGAYEVDVYYEAVKRQIHTIQDKLKKIRRKRALHRKRRAETGFTSISLAGYTSAGKSSLFNALAEEDVKVGLGLFTTLSTTTRAVDLFGKKAFLTDTVGFIDRLPISLIEAFHSTLEETVFSDLILLVLDVSEPEDVIQRKLATSLDTIEKIGAMGVPMITVLNKMDLLSKQEVVRRVELLKNEGQNPVPISALYKTNIDALKTELKRFLKQYIQTYFIVPVNHNSLSFLSWLFAHADVQKVDYEGNDMNVTFQAVPEFVEQVKGQIRKFGGKFGAAD